MELNTVSPAGVATTVLYDGRSTEMLVAYATADGDLHTLQFHETGAKPGEVEVLRSNEWQRKAPAGTAILIPESGHVLSKLDGYWLMWRAGDVLYGQTIHLPMAFGSELTPGERLIDRPIVAANRELHAYLWRGAKLMRHRYGVDGGGRPALHVETVWEGPAQPARSNCTPVPGDDAGAVVVGFVNETESGLEASVLHVRRNKTTLATGKTAGRYRLGARSRMSVHAGVKARPALALVAESYDDGAYVLLDARFDLAKNECQWNRTRIESVPPEQLQSTAAFFYKTQDSPDPFVLAVDHAGHLVSPGRWNVQVIRENVGADYGYPIFTTSTRRYEATGAGSDIKLHMF